MAVVGLGVAVLLCSTGCLFNIFQTARTIGAGNVALTLGTGLFDFNLDEAAHAYFLTPEARLAIGIADGVDLGVDTAFLVPLEGGETGWASTTADLKFALFDQPDSFALALGFGGGYSVEALGWEIFGEVFLDSNARYFPVFFAYMPELALVEGLGFIHHVTAGLKLQLSDSVRLLVEVNYNSLTYFGYGLALEVGF
ncbi:MAG: hypothetical protein NTY63_05165 [Candidatus Bipolaricaulota bacterium]|nr:hypothetical protein [Candidatus Bipolaricaulota bacterium]